MKYKFLIYLAVSFFVFVGLVFYNYFQAQKAIKDTRTSPLSISLTSYPKQVRVGDEANFAWYIEASPDLNTSFTTIYWGYESSPSALTKKDSPEAVKYPNFPVDYTSGNFKLPDNFDLNISFHKPGRVWFRSYAKVKNDHLWSEEKYLDVTN